jgi:hypothetical protein
MLKPARRISSFSLGSSKLVGYQHRASGGNFCVTWGKPALEGDPTDSMVERQRKNQQVLRSFQTVHHLVSQ